MSSISPVSTGSPLQSVRPPPPPPARPADADGDHDGSKATQAAGGGSRAVDLQA